VFIVLECFGVVVIKIVFSGVCFGNFVYWLVEIFSGMFNVVGIFSFGA